MERTDRCGTGDSGAVDADCVAVVLVASAVLLVVGGVALTFATPSEDPAANRSGPEIPAATDGPTPVPYDEVSEEWQPNRTDLDLREVERLVVEHTNRERENRSLPPLNRSDLLSEPAREHAVNMSEQLYVGHVDPSGESPEDRYFDSCDSLRDDVEPFRLAENAAHVWYKTLYEPPSNDSSNETVFLTSEDHVAEYLVKEWMASERHRRALLGGNWTTVGVGVAQSEDGAAVFGAQVFCTAG